MGAVSATPLRFSEALNFTDNGDSGTLLGHSFSEVDGLGVSVIVSAFRFDRSNAKPTRRYAKESVLKAYGDRGVGIGNKDPSTSADNRYQREFYLLQFEQLVRLTSVSITEWGNFSGSASGGDSDVDYYAGSGAFDWDSLGSRYEDDIPSGRLKDGDRRQVEFDRNLGKISWLLIGPEAYDGSIDDTVVFDSIKLRNIVYIIDLTDSAPDHQLPNAVPLPGAVWFLGTALLSIFGFARKR
jgi:hypothetical protein